MASKYKPKSKPSIAEREEKLRLLALLAEKERRASTRKILTYFPDTGPLRRELYQKHLAFFEAGSVYRERSFMAANRIGKTEGCGGYELTLHVTGNYPNWWTGRRFDHPVRAWAVGTTGQTVRDILQVKLLGPVQALGTGLIPGDLIAGEPTKKAGSVKDAIEAVYVRHSSGGVSHLQFKSYEQGRKAFEGTHQDVILLDEETPLDIYTECLTRTMSTVPGELPGILMLTFTPLEGMSETVLQFLPGGRPDESGARFIIQAGWDDVPHLSEDDKKALLESYPLYQRDARSKGIPMLGSGAIYPIAEEDITIDDFRPPDYFPRSYGMDVGWNWTTAVWGAWDQEQDILYLCGEYKRGHAEPSIHTDAIKARGDWQSGVIDPASRGSGQLDGKKLLNEYIACGLDLTMAENAVEAGIFAIWQRMSTGRIKVFRSMAGWFQEFRLYRRDKEGRIVKENDHLMDATRYLVMSGRGVAKYVPTEKLRDFQPRDDDDNYDPLGRHERRMNSRMNMRAGR